MNLEAAKALITNKTARQVLLTRKHSPKILFVAGTVGVVGTVVLACRATLKVSDVLEQHEKHVSHISEETGTEQISDEYAKQIAKVKIKTFLDITKLYAPAVGLGVVSIGALTGSHVVLTKRNTAVMAAYAAMQKGYDEYRERVRKELGVEKDREFAFGAEDEIVIEKHADKDKETTRVHKVVKNKAGTSPYSVLFDATSNQWSPAPGKNASTIMMIQSYANDKLRAQGHLFLNEVFDMLDLPHTKAGAVAGWVYRKDNEEKTGDNYVTFGVFDGDPIAVDSFLHKGEKNVWLEFNVDGIILDLI